MSGHPSLRPASAVCYLPRSPVVDAAELALEQCGLLALVAGARSGIPCSEINEFLRNRFQITAAAVTVHQPVTP